MNEHEIYLNEMIRLLFEWVNQDETDSAELAETIIRKFAIKEMKDQCMVKSICLSFEILIDAEEITGSEEVHKRVETYVAFNSHILADLALGDWKQLNERYTK